MSANFVDNTVIDKLSRNFEYLRISVTDRCNFRCSYCMPSDIFNKDYSYISQDNILSYEEIIDICKLLKKIGLNYAHGTGHGVGFFLNVHEGPQAISKFNKIKLKKGGGDGGHNGLKSIIKLIGSEFNRIRIGVGRPEKINVSSYVLNDFREEEVSLLKKIILVLI